MSSHQLQYRANEERVIPHLWNRLNSAIDSGYLSQISIVFVAYVIAGKLGQATANIRSSNLGPVWPAFGVALAALLICGIRVWPSVAAGAFLVAFFSPVSHLAALGQAAGSTVAAVSGAFLLYRIANFNTSLFRLSDVLSLVAIGGFGSALVSASIGILVLYAFNVHAYSGWGAAWLIYWLGDATGVLLVTPLALTIPNLLQIRDRGRITELAVLLLLLSVVCFIVFGDVMAIPARILSFIVVPFVMWAAIRFGVSACALSMLIVASIATIETALGSGPFVSSNRSFSAEMLDGFFGVLSVTGLMLASLVTEREHAEREREQVLSKQAALEARLEAAHALRLSEERWRLAAQAGKMYAYEWDVKTDAVVRSGEVASVLGGEAPSLTRQQLVARVHPNDRALFTASVSERTPDNPDSQINYRVLGSDGSVKWLEKTAHAYFDEHGRMIRMIGMVTDITVRKRAEEALIASEARLRLAQQVARIGTFERNLRTGHTNWAQGLESLYGLPLGSLDGKAIAFAHIKDLIHPGDWERFQHLTQKSLETGQPTDGEWRVTWPDGSVHWLYGRWQVWRDDSGQPSRVVGVNIDVTERKLADQRLLEYERAVEGSEEMIAVVDREYRYLIANRQFLKLRNMTKEQVIGHLADEVLNNGVFENVVKPKLDECFQGKVVRYEMKYTYPTLGERELLVSYFPVEGDHGVDRAACIMHDITDRKQMEEALAGMSRKLIDAQEQERSRIARELHDDINQRLALLSVELEASRQNPPDTALDTSTLLTELQERINEISGDVQSLSHQLHSSQLEYLGIVAASRSFCREFSMAQNVGVDFSHDDIPLSVPYDISLTLFRVLQEALHNAVKYSGMRHFEAKLNHSRKHLHLTVSDRGVGFDIHMALKKGGLGLVSMRERVRLANGTISIDSKPLHGTTIHVRVPLESEDRNKRKYPRELGHTERGSSR